MCVKGANQKGMVTFFNKRTAFRQKLSPLGIRAFGWDLCGESIKIERKES